MLKKLPFGFSAKNKTIKIKHSIHRKFGWIASILLITAFIVFISFEFWRPQLWISTIGVILSSIYFIQKQKLEELRLFSNLFDDFNSRYDALNEDLESFINDEEVQTLTKEELKNKPKYYDTLIDYFNLCAEEYFYYSEGYIYPEVWDSWKNGMKYYCDESSILEELWKEELKQDSYYGFSLDMIK
jgi:hypothetical protein